MLSQKHIERSVKRALFLWQKIKKQMRLFQHIQILASIALARFIGAILELGFDCNPGEKYSVLKHKGHWFMPGNYWHIVCSTA